jgi:IS5 family transposase
MYIPIAAQKPLNLPQINDDGIHIWNNDLKHIDMILTDDDFIHILWSGVRRKNPKALNRGRQAIAINQILRTGVLKHIKNLSFRNIFEEIQRNLDYRALTQVFNCNPRSVSALCRNIARVDAQCLRELNEHLTSLAIELDVIHGKRYRQDSTVCEANIHYPTDSGLLQDGVRVIQRAMHEAEMLIPSLKNSRDRSRSVLHCVLKIARAARGRGEAAKDRRNSSYRSLLKIVRTVVTEGKKVCEKLDDGRITRHLGINDQFVAEGIKRQLETMLPRTEQVIRQTRNRICLGITDSTNKLVSLFEPKTAIICKGKPHKPTEFGRVVDIVEVENGFVSDYQVLEGNPSDSALLLPALKRHKVRFGKAPHMIATDAGFWSAQNEREARAAGVKYVSIPSTGKLSKLRLRIQRSRWFRQAQRWRANGEGRIGTLKNIYGLDRCMYKGDESMERWVGWCVFAHNLVIVARVLDKKQKKNEETHTTKRQSDRQAA